MGMAPRKNSEVMRLIPLEVDPLSGHATFMRLRRYLELHWQLYRSLCRQSLISSVVDLGTVMAREEGQQHG